ncbi:hypothetical protein MTO96_046101 [Rhipicephalus appendiculatus]
MPHRDVVTHPSLHSIPTFQRLTRPQAMVTLRARSVHVFTDGSYANRAAGAAYVAFGVRSSVIHVGRFRLKRATSAYAAEVLGLVEALKHVLAARYTLPVAIYTDCLSLLQAITSPRNTEPHILEIRRLITAARQVTTLSLYHVPGHAGIFGNEVADFLAQRASRLGRLRRLPLPFRVVRQQLRRELLELWTARWRAEFRHTSRLDDAK